MPPYPSLLVKNGVGLKRMLHAIILRYRTLCKQHKVYGRHYRKSYRQFLGVARGSCFETDYWLEIAIKTKMFNNDTMVSFKERNNEIIRTLTTMMKNLE